MIKLIQNLDSTHIQMFDLMRQLKLGRLEEGKVLIPIVDYLSLLNHIVQPSMEEAMSFQVMAGNIVQKYTYVYLIN